MTDPFLDRLHAMTWPTVDIDRPDPAAGQLWRAAWAETALVVAITAATTATVDVVAASGPDAGDEHTVLAETANGIVYSLWTTLERTLPIFVLDYRIADIELPETLPADGGFPLITSVLDDRSLVQASLLDALDTLEALSWTGDGNDADLMAAADAAGVGASKVAAELDVLPGAARRILRRTQQPTPEQAEKLEELLGVAVSGAVVVDEDLVAEMDRPVNRPQLTAIANETHGGDEIAARRAVAEETFALAARERAGQAGQVDWEARLRQVLDRRG